MSERVDVLVVGAGLAGIDAGYRLQTECPSKSYLILEGRDAIGGTWDLFRYPGVRSDSDMFTLGFPFRPWRRARAIAHGDTILDYIRDTADHYRITEQIRFGRRVVSAHWSSAAATWTVRTANGEEYSCSFLYLCTGYYRYEAGYEVDFPGRDEFAGPVVHPQRWPDDLDYRDKRVVVIGSGATAVTLVPAMAETAAHVTMLQRSPSYFLSLASGDAPADSEISRAGSRLIRGRNVLATALLYRVSRRWPDRVARFLRDRVARQLPADVPVDPHFTPAYAPWDQRLCVVPDGDFFAALRAGRASVVTGSIARFTSSGVRLAGRDTETAGRDTEIPADIIVTATGLAMVTLGEIAVDVDGEPVDSGRLNVYKGMMFSGVPNLAWCVGYINASWTLRADLTARYVCRLVNYMDRHGIDATTPVLPPGMPQVDEPLMALSSGYVQRAAAHLPRQGARRPWRMRTNYLTDLPAMRLGRIDDGNVRFVRVKERV
ncbi:flavin-containing monooxygenase [Paractinoplanes rishiriensis]|uniref:Monooxygenase flavin-binding family protein n=1 Tax=Paractinoplanes rishiriensis TaxID=1050105 RepID=A0A919MXD5_9ACTN|nr:NAD(P)/FAD-dependent oxidoreductase [Actinoplanes rishiriensis]GIE98409.1 monooxygenase flavin-binding family protein [Actinoplanes rishiriensis]